MVSFLTRGGSTNFDCWSSVRHLPTGYDYNVARKGQVVVLTKLYTATEDLPEVTIDECQRALSAIEKMIEPYNPKFPPPDRNRDPMAAVAGELNTLQLEAMSKDGLPVTDLTEKQRTAVWQLALSFYVQTETEGIVERAKFLTSIAQQDPVFKWQQTIVKINAFGYTVRLGQLQKLWFVPISHPNNIHVSPNGSIQMQEMQVQDIDTTKPAVNLDGAAALFVPQIAISITQVLTKLNASAGEKKPYRVEAGLAKKTVTLVGAEKNEPSQTMDSLASLYGLRVVHQEGGIILLTYSKAPYAADFAGLGKAVKSVIPAPVARAIQTHLEARRQLSTRGVPIPVIGATVVRKDYYKEAGHELYLAAVRDLRAQAEPAVNKTKEKKAPLSKLTEQAKMRFALMQTVEYFADACWIADRPLPPYIADFDHVLLTGGLSKNEKRESHYAMFFSYRDPQTGLMRRGVGVGNARLPQ